MTYKLWVAAAICSGLMADEHEKSAARTRIMAANTVFQEIMAVEDKAIPQDLLARANCVAIVPGVKKAAFIVGGKYGRGVLMCRDGKGDWRGPAAIRVEGGSIGFQAGGSETDMVLLVMNKAGADRLMKSEFKIGGEIAVAAGPLGRQGNAATDATMRAEMLGYSRSRGVFGGISLEGSTLREDTEDNRAIYGKPLTSTQILREGLGGSSKEGEELARTLQRYSRHEMK
jgi:lipid-binding SYLF domain-containing protein